MTKDPKDMTPEEAAQLMADKACSVPLHYFVDDALEIINAQRTAAADAARAAAALVWQKAIMHATPGGSEYTSPDYCREYFQQQKYDLIEARKEIVRLKRAVEAYQFNQWQPIETAEEARKTGVNVMVARFDEDGGEWFAVAQWWAGCWAFMYHHDRHGLTPVTLCFEPTHWTPIPAPPAKGGE